MYAVGSQKRRSSLLFDHTLTADQLLDSMRDIQQSLTAMCEMSQVDVRPQLPALFTKFVRQLRALDVRSLRQLYSSAASVPCEKAKYVIFCICLLWSPYGIGQTIIFSSCGFFFFLLLLLSFFPRLISAVTDWMFAIGCFPTKATHGVALVGI